MRAFFLVLLLATSTVVLFGQGFSGGFKAGLSFNNINGPLEAGEEYSSSTNFHIGATAVYMFTDIFGAKAELMYSQKGTKYDYEGDGYFFFNSILGDFEVVGEGTSGSDYTLTNSYVDLPLMAVVRLGRFEIEAGPSIGVLVGSSANGTLTFEGSTQQGSNVERFTTDVEYRYLQNDRSFEAQLISGEPLLVNGGTSVTRPTRIGAYYQAPDNDKNKFAALEFGLNAGVGFFLNKGLYLGGRVNYGLSDITNEEQDVSLAALAPGNEFITRDDEDTNLSIQISLGFRF
ncbi:MAG: porin family protein [Bacteroidota bacterium]